MAFETALAALLARVPRIIVCLRSVPAIDRPDRYRFEYPVLFHALLAAQNVALCCNSRFAAARYGQWLGVDPDKFAVIPNGVARLPGGGDEPSQALYREFDARTGKSPLTLGVVMRLDENKRPLLWVKAAASILEKLPSARFVVVGDGRLRRQVMKWTRERGIAHRFLFAGVSQSVGFWLSKMDLFMLLSKQEGLPNALIEAQLSAVPVVITPAGGAPETMIAGATGIVVDPDPAAEEVAARVLDLAAEPVRLRAMGAAGRKRASESFSVAQMLRETIALMAGGRLEGDGRERQHWAGNSLANAGND
jgi:glycosyltransferase involved in cell wall biosynthesis